MLGMCWSRGEPPWVKGMLEQKALQPEISWDKAQKMSVGDEVYQFGRSIPLVIKKITHTVIPETQELADIIFMTNTQTEPDGLLEEGREIFSGPSGSYKQFSLKPYPMNENNSVQGGA